MSEKAYYLLLINDSFYNLRFEEISSVNFARGGGSTRSFDFEVDTKNGVVHTFSSIEKEEYNRLYDFINNKKLRVKNTGRSVTIISGVIMLFLLLINLFIYFCIIEGKIFSCGRFWWFWRGRSSWRVFGSCQSRRKRTRCYW